jgi:hypothetical protein
MHNRRRNYRRKYPPCLRFALLEVPYVAVAVGPRQFPVMTPDQLFVAIETVIPRYKTGKKTRKKEREIAIQLKYVNQRREIVREKFLYQREIVIQ